MNADYIKQVVDKANELIWLIERGQLRDGEKDKATIWSHAHIVEKPVNKIHDAVAEVIKITSVKSYQFATKKK